MDIPILKELIIVLAEIGVVMLLFTIGIEFSLGRLTQIRKNFLAGGGLQVLMTTASDVIFLWLLHFSVSESIFYGFLVSLSSTAVVLKIYSDRGEMDAPLRRHRSCRSGGPSSSLGKRVG